MYNVQAATKARLPLHQSYQGFPMTVCVGLDVGRSSVKIAASSGGVRTQLDFPSAFCRAIKMADASAMARASAETVNVSGVDYFVGETAIIQGRDDMLGGLSDDWASQPQHAALLLSGLKRLDAAGMTGLDKALIVVGLPARLYATQRAAYRSAISEHLPSAEIKVVPQSMGPYYSMLFDEAGRTQDGFDSSAWGFVEVGQFTTDFAMVERGHVVDRGFDSCDGMRLAAEQLQRLMLEHFKAKVTLAEATGMLAVPVLRLFGREIDVREHVIKAAEPLAESIADKAGQVFGDNVRALSGIRVAGGGAPLVRGALAAKWAAASGGQLPDDFVAVVPNARFAVAEGFLRFALGLELSRAEAVPA